MTESLLKTDADIVRLITSPKIIKVTPRKPYTENKNVSQKFSVESIDDQLQFGIFITYSIRMPQDFSIGLMYERLLLYRCNGYHGTTRAGFYNIPHHAYPHSHTLTIDDIASKRESYPSLHTDLSDKYLDLLSARLFFFQHCGIINHSVFFDTFQQTSLF